MNLRGSRVALDKSALLIMCSELHFRIPSLSLRHYLTRL